MSPEVIYGIYEMDLIGWLVEPFAFYTEQGIILHKLTSENLALHNPPNFLIHKRLFQIAESLSPQAIADDFNIPLPKLYDFIVKHQDDAIWKLKKQEIDSRLHELLSEIEQHNLRIGVNIRRDDLLSAREVFILPKPSLHARFTGKPDEISYRLSLRSDRKPVQILGQNPVIILNELGWIGFGQQLVHLKNTRAKILLPFFSKPEISIKPSFFKQYIHGFLKKLLQNESLEIEIRNLPVLEISKPETLILKTRDFMTPSEEPVLDPYVVYGDFHIPLSNPGKLLSRINPNENEEHLIFRIVRDFQTEQHWLNILSEYGNPADIDFLSRISEQDIRQIRSQIPGFKIIHGDKKLYVGQTGFSTQISEKPDWFDLKIVVHFQDFEIPFSKFIPYIRKKTPVFPLPDGTVFYIPKSWFSEYSELIEIGRVKDENLEVPHCRLHLVPGEFQPESGTTEKWQLPEPDFKPAHFTYRPYQIEGVQTLFNACRHHNGFLLADDMGLGKTLQVLTLLNAIHNSYPSNEKVENALKIGLFATEPEIGTPSLIIVPTSLVQNWKREAGKFFPNLRVHIHTGTERLKYLHALRHSDLIVTTYGILRSDLQYFGKREFSTLILDEAHAVKNPDSRTFKSLLNIRAKFKIAITGTPVENKISDLWSIFHILEPGLLGPRQTFLKNYQNLSPEERNPTIRRWIQPFFLRRTKNEVATDLPDLLVQQVWVDMKPEQEEKYRELLSSVRNQLINNKFENPGHKSIMLLRAITRLRQMANHPKLAGYNLDSGKFEQVMSDLETLIENKRKVLVFSPFTTHLAIYREALEQQNIKPLVLTGQSSPAERQLAIDRFMQDPNALVLLMSLKSGGVGLNLMAADYVLMLDPWWNPQAENQAVARAHRIGRNQSVTVLRYLTSNSVEEKIYHIQNRKARMAAEIFGRGTGFSPEELESLI